MVYVIIFGKFRGQTELEGAVSEMPPIFCEITNRGPIYKEREIVA